MNTRRARPILGWVAASILLAGCAGPFELSGQNTERDRAAREPVVAEDQSRRAQELELKLARSHVALLEKEAQIQALQEKLELATQEVVRSMAKLRGVESKAEAASNLAEAEIALRMLEKQAAGQGRDQELQQTRHLMQMAIDEFKKQNYGGTLYLAAKVKTLSTGGHLRPSKNGTNARVEGEAGFAAPVPLKALSASNVREGPGVNHKVAFVVPTGQALVGHAQKDLWIRVSRDDGRSGWILYRLVGPR
jgi:hypothetical protein